MRVLYVIPGSETVNSFIFAKREFEIVRERKGIEADAFFFDTSLIPLRLLKNIFKLRKVINQKNIQIVHSQYGTITALCCLLVSYNLKLIITFRGSDINRSKGVSSLRSFIARMCSWVAMSFADAVIFVSESLRVKSPPFYKVSKVIPSGVMIDVFKPLDSFECKRSINLDLKKDYLFFYSGNKSQNKRQDLAERAIEYLNQNGYPGFELFVVDGGIDPQVMPLYLNSMCAVLMVSDNEGSPTVVQEALSCGIPVVTVDVGDAKDMIRGVGNSVLVERSPESIAAGILEVHRYGRLNPSHETLSRFSLERCVDRIVSTYTSLVS